MPDVVQVTPDRSHVQPWEDGVAIDLYAEGEWCRVHLSRERAEALLEQIVWELHGEAKTIGRLSWPLRS